MYIEKKCIIFCCGVYVVVSRTKALLRLIKTIHVGFSSSASQKSQTEAMVLPCSILTVFFCNSVTRWSSLGTPGSRALPLSFARVRGATVFLGSLLWDSASMLGFQPCGKQLQPCTLHIDVICLQLLSLFAQSHPTHTQIYMHEQLRVDSHFNKNL